MRLEEVKEEERRVKEEAEAKEAAREGQKRQAPPDRREPQGDPVQLGSLTTCLTPV